MEGRWRSAEGDRINQSVKLLSTRWKFACYATSISAIPSRRARSLFCFKSGGITIARVFLEIALPFLSVRILGR